MVESQRFKNRSTPRKTLYQILSSQAAQANESSGRNARFEQGKIWFAVKSGAFRHFARLPQPFPKAYRVWKPSRSERLGYFFWGGCFSVWVKIWAIWRPFVDVILTTRTAARALGPMIQEESIGNFRIEVTIEARLYPVTKTEIDVAQEGNP